MPMFFTTYLWYLMVILGIFYGIIPSHLTSTIEIRYISILYNPNSVMRYNQSYEPFKSLLIHNTFPNTTCGAPHHSLRPDRGASMSSARGPWKSSQECG